MNGGYSLLTSPNNSNNDMEEYGEFDTSFKNISSLYGLQNMEDMEVMDDDLLDITHIEKNPEVEQIEDHTESDEDNPLKSPTLKDFFSNFFWNEQFQLLLEKPCSTPELWINRKRDIETLFERFKEHAVPIVKILVNEIHLPIEEKTIPPINFGGLAGGDKFMKSQFFFKFVSKSQIQLYGGEHFACKSFSHEIKSMDALLSCNISSLHFPLMLICEYKGFKVIVVSKLPISQKTLVWGSSDGGKTIKTQKKMLPIMEEVGKQLRLAKHHVTELSSGKVKTMIGPVDMEGHLGSDGRFYCVDSARLFPPTLPISTIEGCHLYKLFRPEFMREYVDENGLSSDSFSLFGSKDHLKHNTSALKATNYLLKIVVPKFANEMDDRMDLVTQENLKEMVHQRGINMRFLGYILNHVKTLRSKQIILYEMCSRTIKNELRAKLREVNSTEELPFHQAICKELNHYYQSAYNNFSKVLTKGVSQPFLNIPQNLNTTPNWVSNLIKNIPKYFEFTREPSYNEEKFVSRTLNRISFLMNKGRTKIIKRVLHLTEITLDDNIYNELSKNMLDHVPCPFKPHHITSVNVLVKLLKIDQISDKFQSFEDQEKFYLQELETRISELGDNHMQIARVHINIAKLYQNQYKFESSAIYWKKSIAIVESNRGIDSTECIELKLLYGKFLIDHNPTESEQVLLGILEEVEKIGDFDQADLVGIYDALSHMYTVNGEFKKADEYYDKALGCVEEYEGERATIMHNKAQMYFQLEKYSEAKELFKEFLPIIKREKTNASSEYGIALDNYGQVRSRLGHFQKADELLQCSLLIKRQAFGDKHVEVALCYDHIACNIFLKVLTDTKVKKHEQQDLIRESINYYKKAIEILLSIEPNSMLGITYRNLANIYIKTNEHKLALYYLNKSLPLLEMGHKDESEIIIATKQDILDIKTAGKKLKFFSPVSTIRSGSNSESTFDITSLSPNMKLILKSANIKKKDLQNPSNVQFLMSTLLEIFETQELVSPRNASPSEYRINLAKRDSIDFETQKNRSMSSIKVPSDGYTMMERTEKMEVEINSPYDSEISEDISSEDISRLDLCTTPVNFGMGLSQSPVYDFRSMTSIDNSSSFTDPPTPSDTSSEDIEKSSPPKSKKNFFTDKFFSPIKVWLNNVTSNKKKGEKSPQHSTPQSTPMGSKTKKLSSNRVRLKRSTITVPQINLSNHNVTPQPEKTQLEKSLISPRLTVAQKINEMVEENNVVEIKKREFAKSNNEITRKEITREPSIPMLNLSSLPMSRERSCSLPKNPTLIKNMNNSKLTSPKVTPETSPRNPGNSNISNNNNSNNNNTNLSSSNNNISINNSNNNLNLSNPNLNTSTGLRQKIKSKLKRGLDKLSDVQILFIAEQLRDKIASNKKTSGSKTGSLRNSTTNKK